MSLPQGEPQRIELTHFRVPTIVKAGHLAGASLSERTADKLSGISLDSGKQIASRYSGLSQRPMFQPVQTTNPALSTFVHKYRRSNRENTAGKWHTNWVARKRKKNRESTRRRSKGPTFWSVASPFAGLSRETMEREIVGIGKQAERQFEDSIQSLQNRIGSVDRLQLLSVFATHFLHSDLTADNEIVNHDDPGAIQQHHVELLQALVLMIPSDRTSTTPALPNIVEHVRNDLIAIAESFNLKRLVNIQGASTDQQRAILLVQERLRLHTYAVRNWGFLEHVIRTASDLYEPLSPYFREAIGLTPSQVLAIFTRLLRTCEARIDRHYKRLAPIGREKTIQGMTETYCDSFFGHQEQAAGLISLFEEKGVSREQALALLLGHSDLFTPAIFTLRASDLAAELSVEADTVRRALAHLSLDLGGLEDANLEHLFLDNPVWLHPVIRLDNDLFYCCLPQVFFGFVFRILEGLVSETPAIANECSDRRATFLEHRTEQLLRRALPNAAFAPNAKWTHDSVQYESDLLVQIDSHLLIVEAKSGTISQPALRGAESSAKRHLRELVVEPSEQSMRLARVLQDGIGQPGFSPFSQPNGIDLEKVRRVLRLSVTLDDFAMIQSNVPSLKDSGWLPETFEPCPTMCLSDLEVLVELLDSPAELLFYLQRRTELESEILYVCDEMDLLNLYFECGFGLKTEAMQKGPVVLTGFSRPIDDYYLKKERGLPCEKPSRPLTDWWRQLLATLMRRQPLGWSEVSSVLLGVPFDAQERLGSDVQRIQQSLSESQPKTGEQDAIFMSPENGCTSALAFLVLRQQSVQKRRERIADLANKAFESLPVERVSVISRLLGEEHLPYSALHVIERTPDENQGEPPEEHGPPAPLST